MTRYLVALALAGLTACHHSPATDSAPPVELVDTGAISNFATQAVYEAFPTRALVDSVDIEPAAEPGLYNVHVEMTGGPTARGIYDLVISENAEGVLTLIELVKVQ